MPSRTAKPDSPRLKGRKKAVVARKPSGRYHHGDLRTAMLAAADQLIEEVGIDRLTLRACARKAGVSHGAPLHHFGDVKGLLTELAAEGFEGLLAEMDRTAATAPNDPYSQLVANGQAYVSYALAHRGRFQLMFRSDWIDMNSERLATCAQAAYSRLGHHVEQVTSTAGATDDARRQAVVALAWSLVHGLSTLTLEGLLFPCDDPEAARGAAGLLDAIMAIMRPALMGR